MLHRHPDLGGLLPLLMGMSLQAEVTYRQRSPAGRGHGGGEGVCGRDSATPKADGVADG